jgi:hypothetical protein
MSAGECQTKNKNSYNEDEDEKPIVALDEGIFNYFKSRQNSRAIQN